MRESYGEVLEALSVICMLVALWFTVDGSCQYRMSDGRVYLIPAKWLQVLAIAFLVAAQYFGS